MTDTWIHAHPRVMTALVWDAGDGRGPQPYSSWSAADKAALHRAVSDAEAGTEPALADPPANLIATALGGSAPAATVLSSADARGLYFGYVGRSLMLEITTALPWSILAYSARELAILLDSRTFFVWKRNVRGTSVTGHVLYDADLIAVAGIDPNSIVSWVLPAPPKLAVAFLSSNDITAPTRLETIGRLLEWERTNMTHMVNALTLANVAAHWHYRGVPPVSRVIAGTINEAFDPPTFSHWTAGCPGTNHFMTAVLRAVNIPVEYLVVEEHATPAFPTEGKYLSHGDDPYSRDWKVATPPVPAAELLIDQTRYDAWFSPSLPAAARLGNVGRRTRELMVEHLTDFILLRRCEDLAAGTTDRARSLVLSVASRAYTLAELEAMDLWTRLDAKIASRGGCAAIPLV